MTNDLKGFVTFLRTTKIECTSGDFKRPGRVIHDDEIACEPVRRSNLTGSGPGVFHCHVTFDGTILRLDNDTDYYFSFYDQPICGDANETDHDCVVCTWTSGGDLRHLRRCSVGNRCTGPVEWYDSRNVTTFSVVNESVHKRSRNASVAVEVECTGAQIRSVKPWSAPWTGGTTLEVVIDGHRVLSENRTVKVTVAGRNCVYPETHAGGAIQCMVAPSARADEPADGPVQVSYGGPGQHEFVVTSTKVFQFVLPEVLDVSPTCGLLEGGTVLTVTGKHLDTGSAVTVSLGGNRTCKPTERLEDRIECVTSPADKPAIGPVTIQFDKSLSRVAEHKLFAYTGHPALEPGQHLSGIASGGIALPVLGVQFTCVENATFYVEHDNGRRRYSECKVHSGTFLECRSPELANVTTFAVVPTPFRFGVLVRVAGRDLDLSPRPGDSSAFHLYPDPAFRDFESSQGSVVINGAGDQLDTGYRMEDVVIRFPENPHVVCPVTSASSDRILCMSTATDVVRNVRDIIVTVGDRFVSVVNRKSGTYDGYKLFSAFSGIVILASVALLCLRMLRRVNLSGNRTPLVEMRVSTEHKNIAM